MGHREGISVLTLVVASISSAAAALLTSLFWESGTVFSAALTPVLVTLLREALAKPAEAVSRVRPARFTSSAAASRTPVGTPAGRGGQGEPLREERPSGNGGDPRGSGRRATSASGAGAPDASGPSRTAGGGYRRYGRRWRPNYRVALVTGGVAFLIAASVLTVPELLFGQSVAGQNGRTTLGGGSSRDRGESSSGSTSTSSEQTPPGREAGAAKTRSTPEAQPGQADPATPPSATPATPTTTTPKPSARSAPSTGSAAPTTTTAPQSPPPGASQPKSQP